MYKYYYVLVIIVLMPRYFKALNALCAIKLRISRADVILYSYTNYL